MGDERSKATRFMILMFGSKPRISQSWLSPYMAQYWFKQSYATTESRNFVWLKVRTGISGNRLVNVNSGRFWRDEFGSWSHQTPRQPSSKYTDTTDQRISPGNHECRWIPWLSCIHANLLQALIWSRFPQLNCRSLLHQIPIHRQTPHRPICTPITQQHSPIRRHPTRKPPWLNGTILDSTFNITTRKLPT